MPASMCSTPAPDAFEHLRHDPANPDSLSDDQIFTLTLRPLGSASGSAPPTGLDRWQPERRRLPALPHRAMIPASLSGKQVSAIVEDEAGSFWVGTFDGGLDRMDSQRTHPRDLPARSRSAPASLASDDVRAILRGSCGASVGRDLRGPRSAERPAGFSHYRHDARDPDSLRDSFVMSLYQDPAGLVWIGTAAGGVSRWNPAQPGARRPPPGLARGKPVTAFADAPGRQDLDRLDGRRPGAIRRRERRGQDIDAIVGRRDALGDRRVMALQLDRHGTLWIGTMTSGLEKLTPRSPAAIDSRQDAAIRSSLSAGRDHDHLRGARRTHLARHPRRRRQRARSGDAARTPASLTARTTRGRDQRGERHRHSPRTPRATCGSARTTAASISHGRTAR